jgi:hypothetical protein
VFLLAVFASLLVVGLPCFRAAEAKRYQRVAYRNSIMASMNPVRESSSVKFKGLKPAGCGLVTRTQGLKDLGAVLRHSGLCGLVSWVWLGCILLGTLRISCRLPI